MVGVHRTPTDKPRRGRFRARLLLSFMVPVLLLGVGAVVLLEVFESETGPSHAAARGILAGFILLTAIVAAALAIQVGDRLIQPVAWLLRAIDAGQIRSLSKLPPPVADWEMGVLCNRVRVLLRQNLSGAKAMEELEDLRTEIELVLDAAMTQDFQADQWPPAQATHPLTRRLLSFFQSQTMRDCEASGEIRKLRGLLEKDWRGETSAIHEIVKKAEHGFTRHSQLAIEIKRLEDLVANPPKGSARWPEIQVQLRELRHGIDGWREDAERLLGTTDVPDGHPPEVTRERMRDWDAWVQGSLTLLEEAIERAGNGGDATHQMISVGLGKLANEVSGSRQDMTALSEDMTKLQAAWDRLGVRLRSLMAQVEELPAETHEQVEKGAESDAHE